MVQISFSHIPLAIFQWQVSDLTDKKLECPRRLREHELEEKLANSATETKKGTHRINAMWIWA